MIDLNGQLRLHERCLITSERVGAERLPVLIVDNFLSNPEVLVDYAAQHCAFEGDAMFQRIAGFDAVFNRVRDPAG